MRCAGWLLLSSSLFGACVPGAGKGAEQAGRESEEQAEQQKLSPAEIAERATPAIVSIRTPDGLGTGFIIHEDGWIVTNLHVVVGNREVIVTLADKTALPVVEVLNASARHDLIVLRVDGKKLPVVSLSKSEKVRAGDPVVAIGHPLGLEDTVSNGLVSAVREIEGMKVLQISAPIAPGSSGGPLFNEQGEVIGVATAILAGGQNLNLGVPAEYVRELAEKPEPIPLAEFADAVEALSKGAAGMPVIERQVPTHALSIFRGCGDAAIAELAHGISNAIDVGAPLYNQGNFTACYHVYIGAASDLERRLPRACYGPKKALADGRKRAEKLDEPSARAWAMRDAFDGLIDAVTRKLASDDTHSPGSGKR